MKLGILGLGGSRADVAPTSSTVPTGTLITHLDVTECAPSSQRSLEMANTQKTVIVTGGSQGIGAGLVKAFLDRGYNVVANSRNITKSGAFKASDRLALVDGSIAEGATATKIAEVAKSKFGSIDALVNNAGIRRHIFLEALHGLHGRRFAGTRFRQHRRFSFHHPVRDQADVGSEDRRKHRQYHDSGGSPDRRNKLCGSDDHERRP
jgi:short subunit dehydrogenase